MWSYMLQSCLLTHFQLIKNLVEFAEEVDIAGEI